MTTTATTSWISRKSDRCGGNACIRDTRIPVWSLVEGRRLGLSDARLLQAYPLLTPADLATAWEYSRQEPLEIERSIWENQAVMEDRGSDHRLALLIRGWQLGLSDDAIREAFSPPLSLADLESARRDYHARREAFDKALPALLPAELSMGLDVNGPLVR